MTTQERATTECAPDAALRIWSEIEAVHRAFDSDRAQLGKLFWQLRALYSERANSGGSRLTSGRGSFEREIRKRGFVPRRVREWVNDHEITIGLRPPAESTATKSHARWQRRAKRAARGEDIPFFKATDPVCQFALLLPYGALKAAYRAALHDLHPDHGGSEERTKALISAWEDVKRLHCSAAANVEEYARVN